MGFVGGDATRYQLSVILTKVDSEMLEIIKRIINSLNY